MESTSTNQAAAGQSGPGMLSGLGLAVHRTNLRMAMTRDIRQGQRVLREENGLLEEVLSEDHRMVSAGDMAAVLSAQGNRQTSAILAARKPVERCALRQRLAERSALAADQSPDAVPGPSRLKRAFFNADVAAGSTATSGPDAARPRIGKVNYGGLLMEQAEMQHKADMSNEHYQNLLAAAVRFQDLQTRFGNI